MNEKLASDCFEESISLSFHPAYHARVFGVNYGERYHSDPLYRIEQDLMVSQGYYNKYGNYGLGNPEPKPEIGVGIQPLDFMNGALGGSILFNTEESVWTPDKPLAYIQNMTDITRLEDIDWMKNPLYQDWLRQIEILQKAFPKTPVSYIQGVHRDGTNGEHSFFVMHTPYTTAFRLMGERIFEVMMLDVELSIAIFKWIMRQYINLWSVICNRMNWKGTKIHFGDCAATMLSPSLYERILLPMYQDLMANYDCAVIHSCGPSTHLLPLFEQIPAVKQLQLGHGTDLRMARKLFPESAIIAYYDPAKLLRDSPASITPCLDKMCDELGNNFCIDCGGADPDTPEANITAFLEASIKLTGNHS